MKPKSKQTSKIQNPKSPLQGIRVLDLTRILSGPFCTMKLGDMGAEVIKIEQPVKGDDTRSWGPPFVNGESAYFLSVNRNKKSVTLDLKAREGKEILTKLIKSCDVLVENFRAGVLDGLGFGYKQVKKLNPRIVYCSISGYGQTSSKSNQPSYDLIVQGESGLMDVTGFPDGSPTKAGISLADVTAGTLAFEGILLGLVHRERTGKGQQVDISLLDGLLSLFTYQSQIALSSDRKVTRKGNRHPTITPYETFATSDGYINVSVGAESHWKSFCTAIGQTELIAHPLYSSNSKRVENRETLEKILIPKMKQRKRDEWLAILLKADVPVGNINTLHEALKMETVREREMIETVQHSKVGELKMVGNPIKLSGMKKSKTSPPPLLSEHTNSILKQLGYSKKEIDELKSRIVI